jgi:hypothetical protein
LKRKPSERDQEEMADVSDDEYSDDEGPGGDFELSRGFILVLDELVDLVYDVIATKDPTFKTEMPSCPHYSSVQAMVSSGQTFCPVCGKRNQIIQNKPVYISTYELKSIFKHTNFFDYFSARVSSRGAGIYLKNEYISNESLPIRFTRDGTDYLIQIRIYNRELYDDLYDFEFELRNATFFIEIDEAHPLFNLLVPETYQKQVTYYIFNENMIGSVAPSRYLK